MRGKTLLIMPIVAILAMSFATSLVFAQPLIISLSPTVNVHDPGDVFSIDIDIANVAYLWLWEVKIWSGPLLSPVEFIEGSHMKSLGPTTFTTYLGTGYSQLGCYFTNPADHTGAMSSFTLATVKFEVVDTGTGSVENSDPYVYDITLRDKDGNLMTPNVLIPASFRTHRPRPEFTISPPIELHTTPINHLHWHVGQTLTFDASASYDPDGGTITNYDWDWGDTTTTSTTSASTTHAYTSAGEFHVTLKVTDSQNEDWTSFFPTKIFVSGDPTAEFEVLPDSHPTFSSATESRTFDGSASGDDAQGAIMSYTWDFGDSTVLTFSYPTHNYAQLLENLVQEHTYPSVEATYYPTLTVTDSDGNVDVASQIVHVWDSSVYREANLIMKRIDPSRRPKMPGPVTFVGIAKNLDQSQLSLYVKIVFDIFDSEGAKETVETGSVLIAPGAESGELSVNWTPSAEGSYYGMATCLYSVDDVYWDTYFSGTKTKSFSLEVKP